MAAKDAHKDLQIVVFSLQEQYFGIDITLVSEIINLEKITILPQAPSHVEGVINIRGQVIPVINLHSMFNVDTTGPNENNRVIIVDLLGQKLGLIVSSVYEVRKITQDLIQPAPDAVGISQKYIEGIILSEEDMIVLINLNTLLTSQDIALLKNIEQ